MTSPSRPAPNLSSAQSSFAMAPVVKRLISGENAVYTVPVGMAARLDDVEITNTSDYEVTISISLLNQGVSASAATRMVDRWPLGPRDTLSIEKTRWLPAGVTFSIAASTGDAVTVVLTGLEFA